MIKLGKKVRKARKKRAKRRRRHAVIIARPA
jgi:hypothetical protein